MLKKFFEAIAITAGVAVVLLLGAWVLFTMILPSQASPSVAPNKLGEGTEIALPAITEPTVCRVIHDYQLQDLPEVATTSGNFLHVEYWTEGNPERETILPGNRYILTTALKGHVWEYSGCSFEQVKDQVLQHIDRRLAQKANNAGYVDWESTGFFEPVQ